MKYSKRKEEIYVALQKLMDEKQIFTILKLSRKSLASMLGTNEKYLHDTLKEYTNLAFSEYILSYRLNYAHQLLTNANISLTVENVALQSGFSSRKTFYRRFLQHYNISPAQLRKKQ